MEYVTRPDGASPEVIAELSRAYLVTLPPELCNFMTESDGPILWFGFKELQFLSVADILRDDYEVRAHMPGCIPLCMDGHANLCVAKVARQQIVGYFVASCGNLGWDDAVRIGDTFADLLADSSSPDDRLNA